MSFYQITADVPEDKIEEFVRSLRLLKMHFLEDPGCLGFRLYRDFENSNSFCLEGEFDSRESMRDHFETHQFKVLLGATQVLGRSFRLTIAEVANRGGYPLVCGE